MDPGRARTVASPGGSIADGFGERVAFLDAATGMPLEALQLCPELAEVPGFEPALRERVKRLSALADPRFARVHRVERRGGSSGALVVVTSRAAGDRISEILATAEQHRLALDFDNVAQLICQLVSAVAALHRSFRDVAHGAISAERVYFTPETGVVLIDHVFGSALEAAGLTRDRLWQRYRVAVPLMAGRLRLDQQTDTLQLGLVALALLLGRMLHENEFPHQLPNLVAAVADNTHDRDSAATPALRSWLLRALQIDLRRAYRSAVELEAGLDEWVPEGARPKPADDARPALAVVAAVPVVGALPERDSSAPLETIAEPVGAPSAAPGPAVATHAAERGHAAAGHPIALHPAKARHRAPPRRWLRPVLLAIGVTVVCLAGVLALRALITRVSFSSPLIAPAPGTISVDSRPDGAEVLLDGSAAGRTPLHLSAPRGPHSLELRSAGRSRVIPLRLEASQHLTYFVDLRDIPLLGQMEVRSEPAGARVLIDGRERGSAPLLIDLRAGTYKVVVRSGQTSAQHRVMVEPGRTATLVVALGAESPTNRR